MTQVRAGLSLLALATALLAQPAFADAPSFAQLRQLPHRGDIARDTVAVRLISGKVDWQRANGGWQQATPNLVLRTGDRVRTEPGAMLVMELPLQAGFVHVLGNSQLNVAELKTLPGVEGAQASTFTLNNGKAFVRLRKFNRDKSRFRVETPSGSAAVRGTEFVVGVEPSALTTIGVSEGAVAVSGTDKATGKDVTIEIKPGQACTVAVGQAPTAPIAVASQPIKLTSFLPVAGRAKVSGKAAPGSTVLVNGTSAKVADDGSFVATIPLAADATSATIEAMDATGHVESLTITAGAQ